MRRFLPYLILLAAVALVYGATLRNGFVWDDTALILRDPLIRSPRLLGEGFRHFLFLDATASDFYRPLQRAIYTLDYALAGFTPWVFHLTSLLVHAGAAMALYVLGRRLLPHPSQFPALAVALVWAVHPVHSSAVAYAAGVADPLAALCALSGLALLCSGRRVAAGLALGAALFAKESGSIALAIGLGLAWELSRGQATKARWISLGRVAVPALLMAGLYLGLRAQAEHTPPPKSNAITQVARPVLMLRAVSEYAELLAAPVTLRMERSVAQPPCPAAGAVQTFTGALWLGAAAFWFWRSNRAARLFLLAAGVAYLPVSNLFALNATVAEHWLYLPSAFLFLAAAASWNGRTRPVWLGFAALWVAALGCRTALRCADWRDPGTFLQATIRAGGNSSRMLGNLASLKLGRGDTTGALRDYRAALARQPGQPFAMLGLSGALIKAGEFTEARQWLERCEKIPLIRADALVNLAVLEFRESGRDRVDLLREAAEINPRFWPLRKRYIAHLIERGETELALRQLREVLGNQPFRAETWELLAKVFDQIGKPELAQMAMRQADLRDLWRGWK
jgi:Flp pilus assembly protein TadD